MVEFNTKIKRTNKMKKNQTDYRNQQSDGKSNKPPAQDSPVSTQVKSNNQTENTEEFEVKLTIQRRPQFRLSENMKRRFS